MTILGLSRAPLLLLTGVFPSEEVQLPGGVVHEAQHQAEAQGEQQVPDEHHKAHLHWLHDLRGSREKGA